MPSYTLAQMSKVLKDNNKELWGTCLDCEQAQWQKINYPIAQADNDDYWRLLPPIYPGSVTSEKEYGYYLACFCPMTHRYIAYELDFCDGNVPGEKPELEDFFKN